MKRHLPMLATLLGMFCLTPGAMAAPIVNPTLSLSTAADLSHVTVGQTVTFNVNLSGVSAANPLNFLDATVDYNSSVFGLATNVVPGSAVPNPPAASDDFSPTSFTGEVDASYFNSTMTPPFNITSSGVFYSFNLKAIAAGTGTMSIVFDLANGGQFDFSPSVGPDLSYTVTAAANGGGGNGGAVPLPASAWAGLILLATLAAPALMRRSDATIA